MQNQNHNQNQNLEGQLPDEQTASQFEDWANFGDDDIMQQHSAIRSAEADKIPFVGEKAFSFLFFFVFSAYFTFQFECIFS